LRAGRSASLAVAGGRSPVALFEQLSVMALEWSRVWVTLTDERWVRTASSDSNERLVREHLLRNAAAKANFVGLKTEALIRTRCRGELVGDREVAAAVRSGAARHGRRRPHRLAVSRLARRWPSGSICNSRPAASA
jgi:6-phosphogluconolactonase/glucosamine-6-phosphate isomerase/deaminase